MRFLALYKPGTDGSQPPTEREMAEMGRFIEEMSRAGALIARSAAGVRWPRPSRQARPRRR